MPYISTKPWATTVTISYTLYCTCWTCEEVAKKVWDAFPEIRAFDDTKYGDEEGISTLNVEYTSLDEAIRLDPEIRYFIRKGVKRCHT